MLGNEAQAAKSAILLNPVSAANTAGATGGWVDVRNAQGDILIVAQVGGLTGSIAWSVEDATDNSGTGAAAITPSNGAFAAGAQNQVQRRSLSGNAVRGWIRIKGTIGTGPALVAASAHWRSNNAD